jgi:hypothetical protein
VPFGDPAVWAVVEEAEHILLGDISQNCEFDLSCATLPIDGALA